MKKKIVAMVTSLVLVAALAVGGTLAWLTDTTDTVTNTFTVGNINIELEESEDLDLKMMPGDTIEKDPKVTVKANSEACWLFVEITESANLDSFISYTKAEGWDALDSDENVWYRSVTASGSDQEFAVLAGNQVTVKNTVTKTMMDAITAGTASAPTLAFTAYAVQTDTTITSAEAAWEIATGSAS